ncbi:Glutaredoxin-like protein nrdH [Actinomyces bovis]|uniref:Glutaredoxin-like protein nrdH n=1 Tax=Actinomyces bovis TaxID=1658 RepID=A0ABY1VMZ8_9ACTO|nr:glutaredoxin domain-containing protein [Actinomyces bovis]SPT53479.1 Glutaredoxin-like protein nrdH [Actinomyces bovis]VEG55359.1 Glutaredoxin-like protein nrdH [Actinomyces israelii]
MEQVQDNNPWLTNERSGALSQITIYTKPNCPACRLTQRALDKAGVQFAVVDLSQRPDIVAQLRAEGLLAAPVVEGPDGQRSSGFRPERIKALVELAGAGPVLAGGSGDHQLLPPAHRPNAARRGLVQ